MKPKRPYKNLNEFRQKHVHVFCGNDKKLDSGFFPCFECGGLGRVRDPNDRCPVEGYKMAPWHKCSQCGETGRGTREHCAAQYRRVISKWKQECADYENANKLIASAKSKLTPEEIKALRI